MNWTTPAGIRAQLQRRWDRGELLRAMVTGEPLFPMRLMLKVPASGEISDDFAGVRSWISDLRAMLHVRVEMREFRHRVFGTNEIPHEVWIDSAPEALALLGKRRDAARFTQLLDSTLLLQPQLLDWLAKRPLRALELFEDWDKLLAIVDWVCRHPHSGLYLRQVDIPGVHSKYIESHRGVLSELLDIVLPAEFIVKAAAGVQQFAVRYGFLEKPERIRFRVLDPDILPNLAACDIALDAPGFAQLKPAARRIFITENEINFLAFPQMSDSLVIFGSGYGFDHLSDARWLLDRQIYYWGDIDTHGFAILDQLRSHFAHVTSFLMDRATLLAFEVHWGEESKPTLRDLSRLNREERALYDDLRDNRIRKNLRLEQEKIGFNHVNAALERLDMA